MRLVYLLGAVGAYGAALALRRVEIRVEADTHVERVARAVKRGG